MESLNSKLYPETFRCETYINDTKSYVLYQYEKLLGEGPNGFVYLYQGSTDKKLKIVVKIQKKGSPS